MSSFETKAKNYASIILPIFDRYDLTIDSPNANTFTFDGNQYTVGTIATTETNNKIDTSNYTLENVPNMSTLYAIKSKDNDRYISIVFADYSLYVVANSNLSNVNNVFINVITGIDSGSRFVGSFSLINTNRGIMLSYQSYDNVYGGVKNVAIGIDMDSIQDFLGEVVTETYSDKYGNPSDTDGYSGGSFDNSSDTISIPTKPTIGVSNIGFVNVYCPTQNALVNLGGELFPDFTPPPTPPTSTDVATALQMGLNNVVDNISNFTNMFINSKLIDYVIDCHCIPIKPTISESENIKIGFKSFSQTAPKSTTDYVDFDCGTLNIKEYYTNFIDYVGTRAKLYLPFVGFVPIENEFFQNGLLQVVYRFNIIDGSFMAYVLSSSSKSELSNSVIASYGGNACVHIPITGLNYSNMVSGLASGTVATIATASINKGLGAITAVNSALNTLSSKPSMQSSNGYNSTSAYLGIRYPYLIIEREVSNFSEYYDNENGLPCNITKKISELSGFIQMGNIHMETLPCMEEEKEMIQSLLSSGIIV